MATFVKRLYQVLLTYATRTRFWVLLSLASIQLVVLSSIATPQKDGESYSTFSLLVEAYFQCFLFAWIVADQIKLQFTHPRARLMPRFAGAHLFVPFFIAAIVGIVAPALLAMLRNYPLLNATAINSAMFALMIAMHLGVARFLWWIVIPIVLVPMCLGYELTNIKIRLSPRISLTVLVGAWASIAYILLRLRKLSEDDTAYQQSLTEVTGYRDGTSDSWKKPESQNAWWNSVAIASSDWWNERLGGFHRDGRFQIVRLLRHGFGPAPPEMQAIWLFTAMLIISVFLISSEETEDLVDPLTTIRLLPILIPLFFPAVLAVDPLARRRPQLAAEILLPLERERLFDGLLDATRGNLLLLWSASTLVSLMLLWDVPGLSPSFFRLVTYVFLSAAITCVVLGVALRTVLWSSLASRIVSMLALVAFCLTLVLSWWFMRDDVGDLPFWVAGAITIWCGISAAKAARQGWLGLELGLSFDQ